MTVGKFYATFLIQVLHFATVYMYSGTLYFTGLHCTLQDYFRRFKKKKEVRLAVARQETEEELTVSLQVQSSKKLFIEV